MLLQIRLSIIFALLTVPSFSQERFILRVENAGFEVSEKYYPYGDKGPLSPYQTNLTLGVVLNSPCSDEEPLLFKDTVYKLPIPFHVHNPVDLIVPIGNIDPVNRLSLVLYADSYFPQMLPGLSNGTPPYLWESQRAVYARSLSINKEQLVNSTVHIFPQGISHTAGLNMVFLGDAWVINEEDETDSSLNELKQPLRSKL